MEFKVILLKSPSKRWFRNGIHSLLRRADATFTACDTVRYFVGRAMLMTPQSRSHKEYLIPTNNIIVLE